MPEIGRGQALVFGIALVLWARGVRARMAAEGGLYLSQDAGWYTERADAFAAGDWLWRDVTSGLPTHYPPGYPFVLRLIDAVPGLDLGQSILLLHGLCVLALTVALARIVVGLTGVLAETPSPPVRNLIPERDPVPVAVAPEPASTDTGSPTPGTDPDGVVPSGAVARLGLLRSRALDGPRRRWSPGLDSRGLLGAAIAGAFICGPAVIDHTPAPLTETVFYTSWAWTLALLLDPRRRGARLLVPLTILGAVAVLHRYIAVPFVGAVALWLLLDRPSGPTPEPDRSRAAGPTARLRARLPGGLLPSALYTAGALGPLYAWSVLMGGIAQERKPGELETLEALRDSLVMFGARLLHLPAGRIGGVTGRVQLKAPFDMGLGAETIAFVIAVVVIGAASLLVLLAALRPGTMPRPRLLVLSVSLVAVIPAAWFRVRIGHIYIDRYWALTPTLLLLAVATRPSATRLERALCSLLVLGTVLWSASRYGSQLPAVADLFEI